MARTPTRADPKEDAAPEKPAEEETETRGPAEGAEGEAAPEAAPQPAEEQAAAEQAPALEMRKLITVGDDNARLFWDGAQWIFDPAFAREFNTQTDLDTALTELRGNHPSTIRAE